ncbi:MAG: hypothetical protein WCP45_13360, partial [Verrucomicrobiota bacterium]
SDDYATGPDFNVELYDVDLMVVGSQVRATGYSGGVQHKWYVRNGRFADADAVAVDKYRIPAMITSEGQTLVGPAFTPKP